MKGHPEVIKFLNRALKNELTAIHQYFFDAHQLEDWGFNKLSDFMKKEANEEMGHADSLMRRIFMLGGVPNMEAIGKIVVAENLIEMHEHNLHHEKTGREDLIEAIHFCEEQKDYPSKEILVDMLADEEEHIDWLETQLDLIKKIGLENYSLKLFSVKD